MSEEEFEEHYADIIIKNLLNALGCIGKISEYTPNYDYIVGLAERVTKLLKTIADPE